MNKTIRYIISPLTLKKIAIFFFIPITLYLSGLIAFIYSIPKSPAVAHIKADSGIVLTGGSGRIKAGIDLLEQGKIKTLFISGVHKSLSVSKLLRINALKSTKQNQIILGYAAQNTYGNARNDISLPQYNAYKLPYPPIYNKNKQVVHVPWYIRYIL